MNNLQQDVERLIAEQTTSWETARRNYAALRRIRSKTLSFDAFSVGVQFNPERVRSTTARVEAPEERPCFLCPENRPAEQRAVRWEGYELLVNPYPIFARHLTLPAREHTPQRLTGRVHDMVQLAGELPGFVLTFNGARSGASAPDHFHFQAVGRGVLPAEAELPAWPETTEIFRDEHVSVCGIDHYLRPAIRIWGSEGQAVARAGEEVLVCLKQATSCKSKETDDDEAQVNALCWKEAQEYILVLFPRTAHRPAEYYATGTEQFLLSPGAIDMAGVLITVRPEDYERANEETITALLGQVVPDAAQWETMKEFLKRCLTENLK
ncbi:MAG: DUF4922 domain-containing protein [Rikenellaceae bacterium]|jgi:ATP adenylyltransferase/5',5'''-P-1,P-4-tetraphosphate phosphorylase II|nr:DUF4922 domain-containing protein [Rikenellaceae bacterium]